MEKIIKRIKLFVNQNEESLKIQRQVENCIEKNNLLLVEEDYDLAIAIGGDGAFLRMMRETNFDSSVYYVGINSGTLGFLQEIKPDDIESFITRISNNEFKVEEVGVEETIVKTHEETAHFYSLNEVVIRSENLNIVEFSIMIDNHLLEHFTGDGILVSTSIGSTAYNLSLGGSIVYGTIHTLQITPIAPLNNRMYKCLSNSVVVPENKKIKIIPNYPKDLIISIDGRNSVYHNVDAIETSVGEKKIYCVRMKDYDYSDIIYEKFLQ